MVEGQPNMRNCMRATVLGWLGTEAMGQSVLCYLLQLTTNQARQLKIIYILSLCSTCKHFGNYVQILISDRILKFDWHTERLLRGGQVNKKDFALFLIVGNITYKSS